MTDLISCLAIILTSAISVQTRSAGDTIDKLVETARKTFDRRSSEARSKFLVDLEKQAEKLSGNSTLEDSKRYSAEKNAFLKDGALPSNPFVAKERRDYENAISRAKSELKEALRSARDEYLKAGMIEQAEALESELRAGASPIVERKKKQVAPADPIVGFWRLVIGAKNEKKVIMNIYLPPVDNVGVRSAMARRNQTSPVKYVLGSWSKSGDIYTIHGPNGRTAKVKLRGIEAFDGRSAAGDQVVGFRQQR